ncbi:Asparagine-rich protein (ARP protein) [Mucor velutinosus]|uniref:Asparagine-rich protein (ARP protein) n=1 Tax=Mucor velutinosus TaxID=708070 RepID=A0AAN7DNQ2_9FUNG|nr:Asparagine-rich protein (ARP protein) [Mucor velutinosus]
MQSDTEYKQEIASALKSIPATEISVNAVVDQLQDVIVDAYDGTWFETYKNSWVKCIRAYLKSENIVFMQKTKPVWYIISAKIIAKLSKDYDFKSKKKANVFEASVAEASVAEASVSTAISQTSSGALQIAAAHVPSGTESISGHESMSGFGSRYGSGSTLQSSVQSDVKLTLLTDSDKANIVAKYDALDKKKMWKLSTGTIVEEVMRKCAVEQKYEHLSHSLILNVRDKGWLKYFTSEELEEITTYKAINLPDVPEDVQSYLNDLRSLTPEDLYGKVVCEKLPLQSDKKWVQDSFYQCIRLLDSGFFPMNKNVTEGGLVKRVWGCLDTCFDYSEISCISGEKCSKSSADALNASRTDIMCRQSSGRKMDYVFLHEKSDLELGCGECALVGGVNTTKEMCDANFKMPKIMKDMLIKLVSVSPALKNKLHVCGLYIAESKLELLILDCPSTNVTRYDAMKEVVYPKSKGQVHRQLSAVLKNIIGLKILMEKTVYELDYDVTDITVGRCNDNTMVPCFISSGTGNKKRKH